MKKAAFLLCLLACLGCRKHQSIRTTSCDLCAYAKGVEGTYKGLASGFEYLFYQPYTDSLTIVVKQIFLNNKAYDDSTMMYFDLTIKDAHYNTTRYDTIQINSVSGNGLYQDKPWEKQYWFRDNTARIERQNKVTSGYKTTFDATLYKE